jgi:hypothetical protein
MKIAEIGESVRQLVLAPDHDRFLFDLLLAYGQPKASITRLESKDKGSYNLSTIDGAVLWKKKVLYATTPLDDVQNYAEVLMTSQATEKHAPRFVIVTNFDRLYALDTKTEETLDIFLGELPKHFDFFLPWAGMEKASHVPDNPADVKAAEKMAKLFDLIKADNPSTDPKAIHSLNVFLSRLLFCYFAEDTGIFEEKLFTNKIQSQTSTDGSDVQAYLDQLFELLNTEDRSNSPGYLEKFPYVNGGLFAEKHPAPSFTSKSRAILIECGAELDWSEINPDIFGSMIQAVVDVKKRSNMGMHYTSHQNIMRVIEPLFLNNFYEEFEESKGSTKKLKDLLAKLRNVKFFDPACGSGNFLIITYKEIRKLEMEIYNELAAINKQVEFGLSGIQLSQFYGIELDDFAHEVAILALWLTEHQMNLAYVKRFGKFMPTLPLKPSGKIVRANAATADWKNVCPADSSHVYIMGNPPYLGARQQTAQQKAETKRAFPDVQGNGDLDYISIWFSKASDYIATGQGSYAFVSTNSIVQGVQVGTLWGHLFKKKVEISFAHTSFKWTNNAKLNAGVTCVVIGVRHRQKSEKYLFTNGMRATVTNISPYLVDGPDDYIVSKRQQISGLPPINYGSFALDDGNMTLTVDDRDSIISSYPSASKFFRPFVGAKELLYGTERYCLWIDEDVDHALSYPPIKARVQAVKRWRSDSDRDATVKLASTPHLFAEIRQPTTSYLALPTISSEKRDYLPIAFLEPKIVASNQVYVIPNADPFLFGVIASRMHIEWVKAVCGQLESRVRYSAAICYNNFPIPRVDQQIRSHVERIVLQLLAARESYPELSLAEIYDPSIMPSEVRSAHKRLDAAIESIYGLPEESTATQRLKRMFDLHTKITGKK